MTHPLQHQQTLQHAFDKAGHAISIGMEVERKCYLARQSADPEQLHHTAAELSAAIGELQEAYVQLEHSAAEGQAQDILSVKQNILALQDNLSRIDMHNPEQMVKR